MRASIIIAAHQEGALLGKTIESCLRTCFDLEREIIVADDASTDGSVEQASVSFPEIQVVRHPQRRGVSPTKDLGARRATGDVLVFLDAHTNPEPGAVLRLVEDVELLEGGAAVTPAIPKLCERTWRNLSSSVGHGYSLELETFSCGWLPLEKLRKVERTGRTFYESPALIGCALAVGRELYDKVWGFDASMQLWGVEDLDFSLKCWLMGFPILHDPAAVIGHRFQQAFSSYQISAVQILVSQMRMAYKNLSLSTWPEWIRLCRERYNGWRADQPEGFFAAGWHLFQSGQASAELERVHLHARRKHDDLWYAERFELTWPRLAAPPSPASLPLKLLPFADPSPSPCNCTIQRRIDGQADYEDIDPANDNTTLLAGQLVDLQLNCPDGMPANIEWTLDENTFKDYQVVDGPPNWSASLTELAPDDLDGTSVQFYWVDPGDKDITVTYTLNGQQCTTTASLTVASPTVTGSAASVGQPVVNGDRIVLQSAGGGPGFQVEAMVNTPDGYDDSGVWQFTQTGSGDNIYNQNNPQGCFDFFVASPAVDTNFCYTFQSSTGGEPYACNHPAYAAGKPLSIPYVAVDSPDWTLDPAKFSQQNRDLNFEMYIMFKPPGPSSCWVPLQSMA